MRGDGRLRSKAGLRLLLLMSAGCALAPGQVITSVQSSQNGFPAQNITSVTGGSPLPNGFTIYLNAAPGSFTVGALAVINWNSLGGTASGSFPGTVNGAGSQVSGIVSPTLFQNTVASTVT